MDRSLAASIARTGGRLAAVLLPLAALAVVHALPSAQNGTQLLWVEPGIAAAAALAAGLALLIAVAAAVEGGRVRDLGDAAGLGMLAVTFAVVALAATGSLGWSIGIAGSAVGFAAGSAVRGRILRGWQRAIGIIVVLVLVEAGVAAILLGGSPSDGTRIAPILFGAAAGLLAIAAAVSLDEPTRATALGMGASAAAALALAGPTHNERLVGTAALAMAGGVLGWSLIVHRLRRAATAFPSPGLALPAQVPGRIAEPEFDEGARLTRELRATLDDLVAARRTIGLQRTEIERAASVDPLTGLVSRGPILDRLRMEAAEARRYAHPVAVVLLDIDGFARLNHEHGLQVGDAILREVALRLRLRIREADALGRVGGDAFLAILPHTDEGGAANFARALLDRLLARPFTTDRGEMTVSLSLGIALMRPNMTLNGEELLAAAEEALASAKAAGGNRIAFDRLHGLARLDERRAARETPDDAEPMPKDERRDAR